jgi:hypothetical protein
MTVPGTRLPKPMRQACPQSAKADSRFVPRLRRASARTVQNREAHRERERSYVDMEE